MSNKLKVRHEWKKCIRTFKNSGILWPKFKLVDLIGPNATLWKTHNLLKF